MLNGMAGKVKCMNRKDDVAVFCSNEVLHEEKGK